jgi:hypothetical protein
MAVNRLNVGATNQLLAKASSGQSTNILELQNTAGVTVAGVDASGNPVGGLIRPPMFKNLLINGDMQVAQRATSVTGVTAEGYRTTDRWVFSPNSMGTWTVSQETDAPTGSGFRKSFKVLCTTADASPAAGDWTALNYRFEGQNLQHILKGTSSAKELTLSFWVKSNVTGTYNVALEDVDNTRYVAKSYTVSASATWEKKTLTFPADTTGAFDNDNALSLQIYFWLGAGTNFTSGTLQTSWGTTNYSNGTSASSQTNVAAATNNYWQITGVQLEVGSTATEFEFLPADVELAQCQRYYYRINASGAYDAFGTGATTGTTSGWGFITFPATMRVTPTVIDFSALALQDSATVILAISALTIGESTRNFSTLAATVTGATANRPCRLIANNNGSAYIGLGSEL